MSIPSFIPQLLQEAGDTTIISIVRIVNGIQTQLATILKYLTKKVQLDSVLLQNIKIKSGNNTISHTLGRTLTGWQIVRQSSPAAIHDKQADNTMTNTYLILVSDNDTTISLVVF